MLPFCKILISERCILNARLNGLDKDVDNTLGSYFRVAMASDASFAYTKYQSLIIGPQLQNHLVQCSLIRPVRIIRNYIACCSCTCRRVY